MKIVKGTKKIYAIVIAVLFVFTLSQPQIVKAFLPGSKYTTFQSDGLPLTPTTVDEKEVDLANWVSVVYEGGKSGDTEYTIYDESWNPISGLLPLVDNQPIDLSNFERGTYLIHLNAWNVAHTINDSGLIIVNRDNIKAGVSVNGTFLEGGVVVNPDSIFNSIATQPKDVASNSATDLTWVIKNSDGTIVLSGSGTTIDMETVNNLPDGHYTIETTVVGVTRYGNDLDDTVMDRFILKRPQPTVEVDQPLNPDEITLTQKFPDSELKWEIRDKDNNVVLEGTGLTPSIWDENGTIILPDGEYTIKVTEISKQGLEAIDETSFEVKKDPVDPTDPTNPSATDPTNPSATDPTNPGATDPTNPGATSPTNPGATSPTNPGGTENQDKENPKLPQTGESTGSIALILLLMGSGLFLISVQYKRRFNR